MARPEPKTDNIKESPRGSYAANPVGPAADQCFSYTLKDNKIDPDKNQSASILSAPAGCVHLSSAAIEKGEAEFVICCDKDPKCKDCTATVTLQVTETAGGGAVTVVAKRVVKVVCVKN